MPARRVRRWSATPSAIYGVKITDKAKGAPGGTVAILVTGKRGVYPVTTSSTALKATVVLGDQDDGMAGRCAESAYSSLDCSFNKKRDRVKCVR